MKKTLFFLILVLALTVAHKHVIAQSQIWQLAHSAGFFGNDYGTSVCTDASGNVYVTGYFDSDSIIFGGIKLYYGGGHLGDIFLVKYNASGKVLWATRAGGTGNDKSNSVSTDALGNVYITGTFVSESITFGTDTLTRKGYIDIFLAKYDASGKAVWAKSAGGTKRNYATSVSADASGNVYVTGYFDSDSITFGTTTLTNAGINNMFITKYAASGNLLWAKSAGGTGGDLGNSVSIDASGNVYVTGSFTSPSITFGPTTLNCAGSSDIFLLKYDASGNVLWAKSVGGTHPDVGSSVSTDASGNVFVTGHFFSPSIAFGTTTLTKAGPYDIFLAKYDALGNVLWAKKAGGTGYDYANSVSTDNSGNVYVAGNFGSSSIIFGSDTLNNTGNAGNYDFFLAKYDNSGNVLWAKSAGGVNGNISTSVSTDAMGNVYFAGTFSSNSITFGRKTLYNTWYGYEIFLAKLISCNHTTSSRNVTACNSFVWNNKTYTVSGTYIDTIPNAAGCDSIMTLNLTINTLPKVTLVLNHDTVCISKAAYPLTGGSPIGGTYSGLGVSSGKFDPGVAGIGLHTITYTYTNVNNCADSTSAQILVDVCAGIEELSNSSSVLIFPNPFSTQTTLKTNYQLNNATLKVTDCYGRTVAQLQNINGQTVTFPRNNLASGLYFIYLTQENRKTATTKLFITD